MIKDILLICICFIGFLISLPMMYLGSILANNEDIFINFCMNAELFFEEKREKFNEKIQKLEEEIEVTQVFVKDLEQFKKELEEAIKEFEKNEKK